MILIKKQKTMAEYKESDWDVMFVEVWKNLAARKYTELLMEKYNYTNYQAVELAYHKIVVKSYKELKKLEDEQYRVHTIIE
jgi:hypothetical protein